MYKKLTIFPPFVVKTVPLHSYIDNAEREASLIDSTLLQQKKANFKTVTRECPTWQQWASAPATNYTILPPSFLKSDTRRHRL